jgi:hypothetical protein
LEANLIVATPLMPNPSQNSMSTLVFQKQPFTGPRKIGELLYAADLISIAQLETALYEQTQFETMLLGEILAFHGWISQTTADFFGSQWHEAVTKSVKNTIGSYFQSAGLLEATTIDRLLEEQKHTGMRLGALAVLNGYLKQGTLDFFLQQLFPARVGEPPYQRSTYPGEQAKDAEDEIPWVG